MTYLFKFILSTTLFAYSPSEEEYQFPKVGPFQSTISFSILDDDDVQFKTRYIKIKQGRFKIKGYGKNRLFRYGLLKQPNPEAPLVFLSVGLSGEFDHSAAKFLAGKMYKMGFHVISLDSTFTDRFAYTASTTGYAGRPHEDAKDLYEALKKVTQSLDVFPQEFGFVGFSLGGAVGVHIAHIDSRELFFNFNRVILLNPPLDILHGIQSIDDFRKDISKHSLIELIKIGWKWNRAIDRFASSTITREIYEAYVSELNYEATTYRAIIGKVLSEGIGAVIYMSQQIEDMGILPNQRPRVRRTAANKYTFNDYIHLFLKAQVIKHKGVFDLEEEVNRSNFYGLESFLRTSQSVYVHHNVDDFLLKEGDISFLKSTMGKRAQIYPRGGHLGNLWFQKNIDDFKEHLTSGFEL